MQKSNVNKPISLSLFFSSIPTYSEIPVVLLKYPIGLNDFYQYIVPFALQIYFKKNCGGILLLIQYVSITIFIKYFPNLSDVQNIL